jgi:hypothetical protein
VLRAVEELLAKGTPVVWVLLRLHLIFRLVLVAVVALVLVAGRHMRTGLLQLGVQVALVLHHPSQVVQSHALVAVVVLLADQNHIAVVEAQVVAEQVMVTTLLLLRVQPILVAEAAGASRQAQAAQVLLFYPYPLLSIAARLQVHLRLRLAALIPYFNSTHREVTRHEPLCKSHRRDRH